MKKDKLKQVIKEEVRKVLNESWSDSYNYENVKSKDITKIGGWLATYLRFPLRNVGIVGDIIKLGKDTFKVEPIDNDNFTVKNQKTGKIYTKDDIIKK